MKKHWTLIGFLVSAILLTWAFWDVDFAQLGSLVRHCDLSLVGATLVLNFVVIGLKAERWRQIVAASTEQKVSFRAAALATLIGCMANNVLPARAGELVRVVVLGKSQKLSRATVLATLALDHLLEGVAFMLLMLGLPFLLATPAWMRHATLVIAGILIVGLGASAVVIFATSGSAVERWLPKRLQARIGPRVERFRTGLLLLSAPRRVLAVVVLAGATWMTQALMVLLCLQAAGLELGFVQALFILVAINLGTLIPGAPSSVGPFEFAAIVALGFFGVDKTPALSFALLYHFIQVIPTTLAGWAALPLAGMTISRLGRPSTAL